MNLGSESEYQEHKESLTQLDKGLKSLTAMLNKHYEATVNFGVYDDGEVKGIALGKKSLDDVREKIDLLVKPKPHYELSLEGDETEKQYLKLTAKGTDIPYSYDGRYYIRNVKSDEAMDNYALRRILSQGSFDVLKETDSPKKDLSFEYLYGYLTSNNIHVKKDKLFLDSYGLLNSKGSYNYLAYLLSDKNNISIKVVRFAGVNKNAMNSRTEFGNQSILLATQMVLNHVKAYNITKVDLSEGERKERNLFDYESFREAWINAVVHNDWLHLIPPAVFIYDDRIEISSYGSIPYTMSVADFYKGISKPINPSLFSVFSLSSFAEQSGHGIPTIVEHYSEKAFDFSSNMVIVTIPYSFIPESLQIRRATDIDAKAMKDTHKKVYEYLLKNPHSTLASCAKETNLSLGGVKKIVKSLQSDGKLRRIGPKNNGTWGA